MIILLVILILIALISSVVYLSYKIYHLIKENKRLSWTMVILFILVLLLFSYIDFINTVVVLLEFVLTLLIFNLITFILRKILKKDLSYTKTFIIALIFVICYMSYGYYLAHHVYETKYEITTKKDVNDFRIVQITDSHVGATMTGDDFIHYMEEINKTHPDIVVVTGDFIDDDTSKEDMIKACVGLGILEARYGVYFVYGNHDKGYYNNRDYDAKDLENNLKNNKVIILEDDSREIGNIVVVGRKDAQVKSRKSAEELMNEIDKSKYTILLDHEPNDYENEAEAGFDLVISGHTHGGQLFPLGYVGILIGANDGFYGLETRKGTNFIISSGISGWAIKFKTGTISEYVVIDIKKS